MEHESLDGVHYPFFLYLLDGSVAGLLATIQLFRDDKRLWILDFQ